MNTDGSFAALVFICPRTECAVYLVMYSEPRWRLSCVSPDRLFCRPIAEHQSGWDENTRGHSGALLIITVLGNLSIFITINIYVGQYFSVLMLTSALA